MSPFSGSADPVEHWEHLRVTRQDGVATVTFARPEKLNALTFGAYADLRDLLAELSRERSVRALVLMRRGPRILLGRRRRGDHRRHPRPGHRPAPRLQPDDRPGRPGAARVPLPGDRRRARGRGGRGRRPRAGRRLPGRRPHRPLRLPLHPGRAVRRRHGRRLSAAARRRPRARDPAADAGGARPGTRGRADRPDQRAGRRGPGRRAGRRAGPAGSPTARRSRTRRPRRCSPPNSTCRSPPPSSWTPPRRRCS